MNLYPYHYTTKIFEYIKLIFHTYNIEIYRMLWLIQAVISLQNFNLRLLFFYKIYVVFIIYNTGYSLVPTPPHHLPTTLPTRVFLDPPSLPPL